MARRRFPILIFAALFGCADGGDGFDADVEEGGRRPTRDVVFQFRMLGDASGKQDFRAATDDPKVIAAAREQLSLPERERRLHVNGEIAAGNGGYNLDWSWHFVPGQWHLAEVSIELCDGNAVLVEQAVDYWVNEIGRFCPWGAYVADEVGEVLGTTNQLIVRYVGDLSEPQLESAIRTAQDVAAELGIGLSWLRAGALGIHIFELDGEYPLEKVEELAAALEAADPTVDYAEPDARVQAQ